MLDIVKVKIIKVEREPKKEYGPGDPEITIQLPSGEQLEVHFYEHSQGLITPTKARREVKQRIADEILKHQNRMAMLEALKELGDEFDVDLEEAEL